MTLLESVVALVVVSLAAIGFLNLFEGNARLPAAAQQWTSAISYAEEGMELAKLGQSAQSVNRSGLSRRIERKRYANRVDEILVTVRIEGGGTFALRRLAAAR